ncbi:hypothetical protein OQJ26_04330 [Legionella sp. PATHC038]|uniref:hypothetical protein n=1 Tax=Legionella sheltonii TaxID=2992041 RepID=UPI0022435CA9|nr:hypothetical protein [Legionella sp. PATHC038]MCW8398018.1 hypothetical protein [Legionella sp. PATHC038]
MDYNDFKDWFEAVKKANPNYKELDKFNDMFDLAKVPSSDLIDEFLQFLLQELAPDVLDKRVTIPENLAKPSKVAIEFGVGGHFLATMKEARDEARNARIAREQDIKTTGNIEYQIRIIYENRKKALEQQEQLMHKAFIEHAASKLPSAGTKIELTQEVLNPKQPIRPFTDAFMHRQQFVNFVDQYGFRFDQSKEVSRPDFTLSEHTVAEKKEYTFKEVKVDDIINFSMNLAEKSEGYKSAFETFQNVQMDDLKKQCVVGTLQDIKALIETSEWPLGKWGSSKKIYVNGEPKEIPNNLYKIHEKIGDVNLEKVDHKEALKILEDVMEIAHAAKTDRPFFAPKYRKRDEKVQKAYEVIDEEASNLLKK